MTDSQMQSLAQMIKFFLSKTKDYWESHPEEFYSIYTELTLISSDAK